jgi:hypothetical protein
MTAIFLIAFSFPFVGCGLLILAYVIMSRRILLFADTLEESDSLYAFNRKAEELLGVKVTRISREITIWDLFRQQGMIGNNKYPICSVHLKRELLDEWLQERFELSGQSNFLKSNASLYLGFDWTEPHRLDDMRASHPSWTIDAPMQWEPIWDKCRMRLEAEAIGLPEQELYRLGFPHNNCGGCCVRAGISHWVHLFKHLPERFAEWEQEERTTADYLTSRGIEPLSILKDRRGGYEKPLPVATAPTHRIRRETAASRLGRLRLRRR